MGWHEDHRNTVADHWGEKYRNSGMTEKDFCEYMRKTMLQYGWEVNDINKMLSRAIKN